MTLATVAGVCGVTFAVVAVNGAPRRRARRRRRDAPASCRWRWPSAIVLAPAAIPFATATGPEVDVATIQVDVREAAQASSAGEDRGVAGLNIAAHGALGTDPPPDLIVWGEGALDPAAAADPAVMARVRDVIASVGVPTLVGAVTNDADGRQRTAVLLYDGQGVPIGRYDKVHLVPFGEYVPFRDRLSWVKAIEQIPVDRAPGETVHTLEAPGVPAFGTPICFENSFPELPRAFVRDGAGFLIVPVNNASYGFTAASRAAPADEPDAGDRDRPMGRGRRGLRHQRLHRPVGPRRGDGRACSNRLSCGAPSGPPTNARGTSGWGTGSPGSASPRWRSCSCCLAGGGASGRHRPRP